VADIVGSFVIAHGILDCAWETTAEAEERHGSEDPT